jgi:hypothetical protein
MDIEYAIDAGARICASFNRLLIGADAVDDHRPRDIQVAGGGGVLTRSGDLQATARHTQQRHSVRAAGGLGAKNGAAE